VSDQERRAGSRGATPGGGEIDVPDNPIPPPARPDPEPTDALTPRELKRMRRVTDSMLSSHSALRDRYRRRSQSLTLLIIALSIAAASVSFASADRPLTILYVSARLSRWVAVVSLLIFFLAMVDLVIDWRRRTLQHDEAARRLGDLKARLRVPQIVGDRVETAGADPRPEYERTMAMIPPIPDRQFAPLKARAAYKVELSKAIDDHHGAPTWWLRLLVRWRGMRGRIAADAGARGNGVESVDADVGAIDGPS
jgi:hypothetical protein